MRLILVGTTAVKVLLNDDDSEQLENLVKPRSATWCKRSAWSLVLHAFEPLLVQLLTEIINSY